MKLFNKLLILSAIVISGQTFIVFSKLTKDQEATLTLVNANKDLQEIKEKHSTKEELEYMIVMSEAIANAFRQTPAFKEDAPEWEAWASQLKTLLPK